MKEVLINTNALYFCSNTNSPYNLEMQDEMIKNPNLYKKKQRYFTQK